MVLCEDRNELISISEASRITKIPRTTLRMYLKRGVNTITSLIDEHKKIRYYYKGKWVSKRYLFLEKGVSLTTAYTRLSKGGELKDAVSTKPFKPGKARSKLNVNQVLEIYKSLWFSEKTVYTLSKEYGVSDSTIRKIKTGETWGWLTSPLAYVLL